MSNHEGELRSGLYVFYADRHGDHYRYDGKGNIVYVDDRGNDLSFDDADSSIAPPPNFLKAKDDNS